MSLVKELKVHIGEKQISHSNGALIYTGQKIYHHLLLPYGILMNLESV